MGTKKMGKRETCQDCICCSAIKIRFELCGELRRTGACLMQNSQRIIIMVVRPNQALDCIQEGILVRQETGWG